MILEHQPPFDKFEKLRKEAMALLDRNPGFVTRSGINFKDVIHELGVYQTELILQNEELKESRDELARITREYEALYEKAPCGYITLTPKGIISKINRTALRLIGNQRIASGIARFGDFVESGWDNYYYAALKQSGKTGEKQSLDLKLKSNPAKQLWVQMEIEADQNKAGHVLEWRLVCIDISRKIRAEKALQESRERFETLFHKIPIAYQSLDKEGRFIEVNDSWLKTLGYQRKEVLGKNFADFLPVSQQAHFKVHFPRFKRVGEIMGAEFEMIKSDGSRIIVAFHGKISRNTGGEFKQTHCVLSDITEQKKIERTAKRLELQIERNRKLEAIGMLAGGIAHDFNNVLHPIIGYSELSLQDLVPDSVLRQNIEEILRGAKRAAELVRQILQFSSQKQKSPEPVMVQAILKDAVQFLRSTIPSNIEFNLEISPNPIYILCDPIQMYEIAMNLCINAYQAMEEKGGLLSIAVNETDIGADHSEALGKRPGRYCQITITDSGIGIPQYNIDKIFDPYFTTKDVGKGSGMGLSVVHGIVKKHEGRITVKSRPGRTQFDLYFPVIDPPSKGERITEPHVQPSGNETILLVDDETAIVNLMKRGLDKLGYNTQAVTSSVEALEIFENNPEMFDIVISDVEMPKMIGTTLIRRIRHIRPDIPVILYTGFSRFINRETVSSLDIDELLFKPISIENLSSRIRRLLDQPPKA